MVIRGNGEAGTGNLKIRVNPWPRSGRLYLSVVASLSYEF